MHENNEWMPPIRQTLNDHNIPFEEWHLFNKGMIDLTSKPAKGIFLNRASPSAHTRGHNHSSSIALSTLNWLESHKRTIINGSNVMYLEISKVAQYNALIKAQIKAPRTIATYSKEDLLIAANKLGFPLITKHNCGGKGSGVRKFNNIKNLEAYLYSADYEEPIDGINLVQEFIESEDNYITRLEFIGKKFIYAVRINNEDGFNLCPADSCFIEGKFCANSASKNKFKIINDFYHPIVNNYEKFLRNHNIDIAGIEFIQDKNDNIYTYDINANSNYNIEAENSSGLSAHKALAEFILSKAE